MKQFRAFAGIGYGKRHASFAQKLLKQGARHRPRLPAQMFHLPPLFQNHLRSDREGQPPQPQTTLFRFHAHPAGPPGLHSGQPRTSPISRPSRTRSISSANNWGFQGLSSGEGLRGLFTAPANPSLFCRQVSALSCFSYLWCSPCGHLELRGFGVSKHHPAFVSHLAAYQGLFRQLNTFRFLYIAAKAGEFSQSGRAYSGPL